MTTNLLKLIILRSNFLTGLNSVEKSVGDNTNLPILKNILLSAEENKIILTSTNLELAIKYRLSGKIITSGSITIPFSVLNTIIKNLNTERITLEATPNSLIIQTDNYEATIQGNNTEDFPVIPSIQNKKQSIKINTKTFKEVLVKVSVATQYSDIRPEISGVLMVFKNKELTFVATDGFRLAEIVFEKNEAESSFEDVSVIVPLKTTTELLRILDEKESPSLEVFIDQNQILFQTESQYIISRLIDGSFPEYHAIIPKQTKTELIVNRLELVGALNLAKTFSGKTNDVALKTSENKKVLEVFSADSSLGENKYKIPIKLKGDPFMTTFNWKYILDGLKIYESEDVVLQANAPDKPIVIRSQTTPHALYVVMPLKT